MAKNAVNSKYLKKLNRMTILNLIKNYQPIGRQDLAHMTGLTPAAITGIIRQLLELNLVEERGLGKSNGGRRPMKLVFNGQAGYVIGLEVTHAETIMGVADLTNQPTDIKTIALDMTEPERGLPALVNHVNELMRDHGANFLGIGIAFPGLLQASSGIVRRSVNLGPGWDGFPLREYLTERLEKPIFIENNSNASVLAERWFGGGTNYRDLVYVNLGEGISAGIILDDHILQGFSGYAGEIGHIVMATDGPLCNCGNRGCLEALCGIPALVRQANNELPYIAESDPLKALWRARGHVTIEDIGQFVAPDTYSRKLLQNSAKHISVAIADIINLYNPQAVFLGGKLAASMIGFCDILTKTIATHAFPEIAKSTVIEFSSLGINSGVIGACALALRELLQSPESELLVAKALDVLNTD